MEDIVQVIIFIVSCTHDPKDTNVPNLFGILYIDYEEDGNIVNRPKGIDCSSSNPRTNISF